MAICLCFCLPQAAWAQEEDKEEAEKKALALHQKTMKEARALHQEIQSLHRDLENTAQEVGELREEWVDADQKRRQEIDYQGRIKQQELERISAQLRDKQMKIFDLASRLIAREPGSVEFREMRCDAAFAKEAFDIVLEDIERVSAEKRESVDYLMIWGQSLERKARFKEAIDKYLKALAVIPKERQPFVRFSLANCYFNAHQFEEAFKYYAGLAADAPAAAKQQYENISKVAAEYVKLWEKELALRKEEESKGTNPIVVLELSAGEIKLELFEDQAPNMTANFIHLVESGFYDGLSFFKVVPQHMVVSGCPEGEGTGGPG
jgi:tetratricopeptide (TPR) repeat protein